MIELGGFTFPGDLAYFPVHHMWVRREPEGGRAVVGIDMLGLASLGDLAYIALHEPGTRVRRDESIGTLEAAKMTGDFIAPLSGTVLERNEEAIRDPFIVNQDPYGAGWLVAIAPDDGEGEAEGLISGPGIRAWVLAELARFRSEGWIN